MLARGATYVLWSWMLMGSGTNRHIRALCVYNPFNIEVSLVHSIPLPLACELRRSHLSKQAKRGKVRHEYTRMCERVDRLRIVQAEVLLQRRTVRP